MAEVGVIALDPVRLGGLETYLQGLADGCRRRAGRVADAVAGSGLGAERPVGELERLAVVCRREGDEVRWRRALVEALPHDLPLPPRLHPTPTAAGAAAEALALDVVDAVDAHPPRWSRLTRLLAELDRNPSASFAATFFGLLGPVRARQLPLVLERARRAAARDPGGVEPAPVLDVQARLADALRVASRAQGPQALGERWFRVYAGLPDDDAALAAVEAAAPAGSRRRADEVERTLRSAGYGLALASTVARAVGWRRAAVALTVDRGLLGLVAAPLSLADGDGLACDGAEVAVRGVAAGVTVVGAVVPGAGLPAFLAVGILSGLATVLGACRPQPPRRNETRPTVDPATGQSRLPSGHQSNPRVDGAGVPLPPAYG